MLQDGELSHPDLMRRSKRIHERALATAVSGLVGAVQAGEMNLNPTDPRAQLVNGLPNNTQAGGYGSPLAGVRTYVQPTPTN